MQSDPRVFFASERTLLAWLRTGIAITGLGFVVSRFGLFLRLIAQQSLQTSAPQGMSHFLGIALIVIGSASMAVASVQHARFIQSLPQQGRPANYSWTWSVWFGAAMSLASIGLAAYLASGQS